MNDRILQSLFTIYYLSLLVVLILALLLLNQQFKKQAIENITRAQDNIVTELTSGVNTMSMRLK